MSWDVRLDSDEVARSADRCIKCNVCNTACPVMPATDLFPGPKYCGPQAERFRAGDPIERWVDYCSGCGACTRACPTGVMVAELNSRARARARARQGLPLRDRLLSSSEALGRLGGPIAPLANLGLRLGPARALADTVLGIDRRAPLPAFSRRSFRAAYRRIEQPAGLQERVAYFCGCATGLYEPWVGEAAVRVLNRHGFFVEPPVDGCCGLPFISNGDYRAGRRFAERLIARLLPWARAGVPIVATSTSCSFSIKSEYRHNLGLDSPELREVASVTYDIFELLRQRAEAGLELRPGRLLRRVLYHAPCQLRSHGIGVPALELLGGLEGIRIEESGVECCGIAGTYGLKSEKYEIARRVGAPLVGRAEAVGAELVACDSETCRWQIEHLTGLVARHPIELLEEAQLEAAPAG